MCVIFVCESHRPSPDQVKAAFETNAHGAGIAYRGVRKNKDKKEDDKVVVWKKGLNLEAIQKEVAEAPLPFIAHFRVESCGGKHLDLTHPFPIHPDVSLALSGSTKGYVLFHNGHFASWKSEMKTLAIQGGGRVQIPSGHWSDTRAMALMAAYCGLGILEGFSEKLVAFGPERYEVFDCNGFYEIEKGFWASNRGWERNMDSRLPSHYQGRATTGTSQTCIAANCNMPKAYNSPYCHTHKEAFQIKCHEKGCDKPQLHNSKFCATHDKPANASGHQVISGGRFICIVEGCNKDVLAAVTSKYCEEHIDLLGPQGVTPEVRQFRQGEGDKTEGKDVKVKLEEGKKGVEGALEPPGRSGSVRRDASSGSHYGSLRGLDPTQMDQFRWVQSLNPKVYKRRSSVPPEFSL